MAKSPPDPESARIAAIADARRLMRLARTAALASLDPETGAPLTTLVGIASDFDGAPLFLMSTLARHTRHLAHDPRTSVLLTEANERGDPLNHPRITLSGAIGKTDGPRARLRYLQRNPKAILYADFADFAFFRLSIEGVHFNGGFGRADALAPADILISRDAEAALAEAEPRLTEAVDDVGEETLRRLARLGSGRRVWRAVGIDAEGFDLSAGSAAARVAFPRPAHNEASWLSLLEQVAGDAEPAAAKP